MNFMLRVNDNQIRKRGFCTMNAIDSLREQIRKTEVVLAESREYFEKNPESYSAKLLLISTENHLSDLLKQLDAATGRQ